MRLSRVYQQQKLYPGATINLDRDGTHYLVRVLRLKPGDAVNLFNSEDGEFAAELVELDKKEALLHITAAVDNQANPALTVHLGLGLSRGERMDYAIQKSTELGVTGITPLFTEHCEVKLNEERQKNRRAHWQQVAISASEQCGRSRVPDVHLPRRLDQWLSSNPGGILLDASGEAQLDTRQFDNSVRLLIGPEGGLSEAELTAARQQDYHIVRLGPRILRTETAPVVALSLLQYLYGDLA